VGRIREKKSWPIQLPHQVNYGIARVLEGPAELIWIENIYLTQSYSAHERKKQILNKRQAKTYQYLTCECLHVYQEVLGVPQKNFGGKIFIILGDT
jgi:hypothetical protein